MTFAGLLACLLWGQVAGSPSVTELARANYLDACYLLTIQKLAEAGRSQSMGLDRHLSLTSCSVPNQEFWAGLVSERPEVEQPTLAFLLPPSARHSWTFLIGGPTLVGTKVCIFTVPLKASGEIAWEGALTWEVPPWACLRLPRRLKTTCDYRASKLAWLASGELEVLLLGAEGSEDCEFKAELSPPQ